MIALIRTEMVKAFLRARTLAVTLLLVGLPLFIVTAISSRRVRTRRSDGSVGLYKLAQESGLAVPAAVLNTTSTFLLIVLAGLMAGDAVAGDASWGNLRYVLMRPVNRVKLLLAKTFVAAVMIWFCVVLITVAGLIIGIAFFGAKSVTIPGFPSLTGGDLYPGFDLSVSTILLRLAVGTAYVAFGYTALLGIGVFFSTITDAPTGAVGGAVGVYVVSQILDAIPELGAIRYGFPTHYLTSWQPILTENRWPTDMLVGIGVQLAWFAVFMTMAIISFNRRDVHS